jgi:predicted peptidase
MKKIFLFLIILISSWQQPEQPLKTIVGKTTYPFWVYVPKTDKDEKLPILLFLHGKSLSGTDINKVKKYGVLKAMEKGRKIQAIVVAPQIASGSWNPNKLLELIHFIQKNYTTDTKRVYVIGMSLGGYGTLHFAGKYPNTVTAGVAICGGGNIADACNLAKIPLWIQHGNKDSAVPHSESQKIYDAIKKCDKKANTTLTIIQGGTHGSVENLFHKDTTYKWLFQYKK